MTLHYDQAEAIAIIQEAKRIHQDWKNELHERGKQYDVMRPQGPVGNAEHHQEWIDKYDKVLVELGDKVELRPLALCSAYFRALMPRKGDDPDTIEDLTHFPLPPAPAENWFWKRVIEEIRKGALDA